jgi:hypothetical protein
MTAIKVTPEGRPGVWLADRDSLKAWVVEKRFDRVHNFVQAGGMLLGADHEVDSVIADIDAADRIAVLTGDAWRQNSRHALALIMPGTESRPEHLEVYDVGEVTDADLEATP